MLKRIFGACLVMLAVAVTYNASAQAFTGEKGSWHGFDRYDFIMDEATLKLTPIVATEQERNGAREPERGTRRCIVVVPKKAAPGNPWTWRGCYWDHEPQAEIELLNRGFHVAYVTTDPDKTWDAWYEFLVKEHGLSPKPSFIGMSRGGSNAYTWGTNNPDKVTAICADNPGLSATSLMKMDLLAKNDVPLLNICGSTDPILVNTYAVQSLYHANKGRISVLIKDGPAHHPHSLRDPNLIADFIEDSFNEKPDADPVFLPERFTKSWYYSTSPVYSYLDSEKVWTTTWGPLFAGAYRHYSFSIESARYLHVYAPKTAAPGMPWVYRADVPESISAVDFELLKRGYHIVVGPVPTSRGPIMEQWNSLYTYLTGKGFSKKPILAGCGAATGEVYIWGEQNPDKVSLVYGENPIMRASIAEVQPMDNLSPLAKAGVPLIHVCGSLDPNLDSQTREVEKRYKALGGQITVVVDEGKGHYPLAPSNPVQVVDLIVSKAK